MPRTEDSMPSEQKVAIITGASQGIGAALVTAYRERNFRVVATARSMQPSTDDDILDISVDITEQDVAERVVRAAIDRFGRIDTLVNNAGIFISKPFTQYSEADYAAIIGVNLTGFFRVTQRSVVQMEQQGSGHIVQISASLADHANSAVPSVLASMTKGALNAATKSLAIEYARRGIRVNAVAPGVVKTPMYPPEAYAELNNLHPMGRIGEISDIVGAILYLETASFVTGDILYVDGGQSAGH